MQYIVLKKVKIVVVAKIILVFLAK